MRIDSHHHVWDLTVRPQDWIQGEAAGVLLQNFSLDDLRVPAAAAGVTHTVLVQTVDSFDETPELLAQAHADPLAVGVVGWLDMELPSAEQNLETYLSCLGGSNLVAIRDLAQYKTDPKWLVRADVVANVKMLGRHNLTYDLLTLPAQLQSAIDLVKLCPEVSFVLDHISKPCIAKSELEPWGRQIRELALLPNVDVKVSGMVTEANWHAWKPADFQPYIDVLLEAFGPKRLMFGSDWPVCLLAGTYAGIVGLAETLTSVLNSSEKEEFWSGTVKRAYRLRL
jgi:L-fuconolactonase